MIVTFCGHRGIQEPEKVLKWLYETVVELIWEGADCFYLGGYGQFDTMAADVVRELKQEYPHIRSVLVLPYLNREYNTSPYDESIYPPLERCRNDMPSPGEMSTWSILPTSSSRMSFTVLEARAIHSDILIKNENGSSVSSANIHFNE